LIIEILNGNMLVKGGKQMSVILITGATDGIGREVAKKLASEGYDLILHGRNELKLNKLAGEIKEFTGKNPFLVKGDLSTFSELDKIVKTVKEDFKSIDWLLNNAATFEPQREVVDKGFEKTFMVNYIAPFYLTVSLLKEGVSIRYILNVSSMAHASSIDFQDLQLEKGYDGYKAYSLSKLYITLFTYYLAERLKGKAYVNCLHPGVINTKLLIKNWGPIGSSVEEGAKNVINAIKYIEKNNVTGVYFDSGRPSKSKPITYDKEIQKKLWEETLRLVGIKESELNF
jgi:NAD(P)-dependent dehydrogenase (short-subunit alcohol dehydrogenase family)